MKTRPEKMIETNENTMREPSNDEDKEGQSDITSTITELEDGTPSPVPELEMYAVCSQPS